jgi:hypothetical protein
MRRNKIFIMIFFSLLISLATQAEGGSSIVLAKGSKQLNAGIGLSTWGLPIYVGLDYGLGKNWTLGGEGSFRSHRESFGGIKFNHTILGLGANANYHFNEILNIPSPWNLYAGANIGFFVWSSPNNYRGTGSSGLGIGGQIGGRYFLNDNLGLNLEFGGGNSFSGGKFGLTYKF